MGKLLGLQKTGYSQDTPDKYLIDAATIYKDLVYNQAAGTFSGELIGATNGGVEIDITQKYRDVEVDGTAWSPVKGNKVLSNTEVVAKTSIKEFTAETLRLSINGSRRVVSDPAEAPVGYEVVEGKRYVEDGDYIDNIAVVGKITGTNRPIIFVLDNCLATAGAKIKTEDDKEGEIPIELTAHVDYDQLSNDVLPYKIFYPTTAETPITGLTLAVDGGTAANKLAEGTQYKITATAVPTGANVPELVWGTLDSDTAKVDQDGNLTTGAAGTTSVIAMTTDGAISATLDVTVIATVPVTGIAAAPASKDIKVGDTGVIGLDASSDIKLTITPAGANAYALSFSSEHPEFATIDPTTGQYEAVAAGNSSITITATNTKDGSTKTATTLLKVTTP